MERREPDDDRDHALVAKARACSRAFGGDDKYDAGFWSALFFSHHVTSSKSNDDGVGEESRSQHHTASDDLLFFVYMRPDDGGVPYFVRRQGSSDLPDANDLSVDWEATYFLNQLCNRISWSLVVTTRANEQNGHTIITKSARQVFASPTAIHNGQNPSRSQDEQIHAFPMLAFQLLDALDHGPQKQGLLLLPFSSPPHAGCVLGVELLARGHLFSLPCRGRVFSGALHHEAVSKAYLGNVTGWWTGQGAGEAIVGLRGPRNVGEAKLMVTKNTTWKQSNPVSNTTSPVSNTTSSSSSSSSSWWSWLKGNNNANTTADQSAYDCMVYSVMIDWKDLVKTLCKFDEVKK